MARERNIDTLTIDGGILCLNFVNTVYAWRGKNLHEYLETYDDVIRWCRKLDLFNEEKLGELKQHSDQNPYYAADVLTEIKSLRLIFYKLFSSIASRNTDAITQEEMKAFNTFMSRAFSCISYQNINGRIEKTWNYDVKPLWIPLIPVLISANELLTSKDYNVVKECPHCGWLFIDTTKNKKKIWCSPASCGSNDKAKRYYSKVKLGEK